MAATVVINGTVYAGAAQVSLTGQSGGKSTYLYNGRPQPHQPQRRRHHDQRQRLQRGECGGASHPRRRDGTVCSGRRRKLHNLGSGGRADPPSGELLHDAEAFVSKRDAVSQDNAVSQRGGWGHHLSLVFGDAKRHRPGGRRRGRDHFSVSDGLTAEKGGGRYGNKLGGGDYQQRHGLY